MSVRDKIVLLSALIVIVGGALIINGRFNARNAGMQATSNPSIHLPNRQPGQLTFKETDQMGDARDAVSLLKIAKSTPAPSVQQTVAVSPTPVAATQDVKPNPIINEVEAAVRATVNIPQTPAAATVAAAPTPAVAAPAAAAAPVATGNTYTVQKGQTLIDISLAVYKDKANAIANARKIYEYNKDQMANMDRIKIGQKLRIPPIENPQQPQSKLKVIADSMQDKVPFMSSSTYVPAPKSKTYTIKKGDSLWTIAQRTLGNGSRYKEIVAANKNILDGNKKLSPGTTIIIPNS